MKKWAMVAVMALAVPSAALAGGKTIELSVTSEGFVPTPVKVKKGEEVTLVITRKVERTCARQIVVDAEDVKGGKAINTELPLDKAVTVKFTPAKSGELKYGCSMNKMIGGVLNVE